MRGNRARDTGPELAVRKLLSSLGYRYRLHRASLPGKPDVVFPGRKKAIFVHGCFWHQHENCRLLSSRPKTNSSYWGPKLSRNKLRDAINQRELHALGWRSLVIWECQLSDPGRILAKLDSFLKR
jgi:DNA mismatch endonuclease (patch repair protein)